MVNRLNDKSWIDVQGVAAFCLIINKRGGLGRGGEDRGKERDRGGERGERGEREMGRERGRQRRRDSECDREETGGEEGMETEKRERVEGERKRREREVQTERPRVQVKPSLHDFNVDNSVPGTATEIKCHSVHVILYMDKTQMFVSVQCLYIQFRQNTVCPCICISTEHSWAPGLLAPGLLV